ncbi:MAG: MlaC/ttg2D family ABC transporter substrate-binding protein [Rhodospirillales bacterium]
MQTGATVRILAAAAMVGLALGGSADAQNIAPEAAKKFIADMGGRTVATLEKQGNPAQRNNEFTRIMIDALDFEALALSTLGKMARNITPADKKEFTRLFAAYVIDVAIERFGNLQISGFGIGEVRLMPNGDVKVNTAINRSGDKPISVDWRVRNTAGSPRINDMEIEGYSLSIHYQGEFQRAGVSTVGGLIKRLQDLTSDSKAMPAVQQAMK